MKRLGTTTGIVLALMAFFGATNLYATPTLSLGTARAVAGQTTTLDVLLSNATTPCAGVNAKIILPATVTLTGIEKGSMLNQGAFTTDYRAYAGGATFLAYSGSDTFTGARGNLLRLRLRIDAGTPPGTYPIRFAIGNPNIQVNSRYALSDATGNTSLSMTVRDGTLIVDEDSNSNGMGDAWEIEHFDGLHRDGTGDYDDDVLSDLDEYLAGTNPRLTDTDGDGMSDYDEIIAGTSPTDPGDCFRITEADVVGSTGPFTFYWETKTDRQYGIYSTTNLASGWTLIRRVSGDGARFTHSHTEQVPFRFFQIRVERQ